MGLFAIFEAEQIAHACHQKATIESRVAEKPAVPVSTTFLTFAASPANPKTGTPDFGIFYKKGACPDTIRSGQTFGFVER